MQKDGKAVQRLLGISFTFVGAIVLAVAIGFSIYFWSTSHGYIQVTATITEAGNNAIEYEVNGKTYLNTLNYTSSSHYIGYKLPIWVNPDNPNEIIGIERLVIPLCLGGFGLIFFSIGLGFMIFILKYQKKCRRLLRDGTRIMAEITGVSINPRINGSKGHPYIIHCCWTDPYEGIHYHFRSDNIWYDPWPVLKTQEIHSLPVYIDMNRKKDYAVSLESLQLESNVYL